MVDLNKMKKRREGGGRPKKDFDPSDLVGYDRDRDDDTGQLSYKSIEHITEGAGLLLLEDDQKIWIPKSQIVAADESSVTVTKWWADENGVDLD